MLWMGNDAKFKTPRPVCVDFNAEGKAEVKGLELTCKVDKMNVLIILTMVGSMSNVKKIKNGSYLKGLMSFKGEENKDSRFSIGHDKQFGFQSMMIVNAAKKEDIDVKVMIEGESKVSCDLEKDNMSLQLMAVNSEANKMETK